MINKTVEISNLSLGLAFVMVVISLVISYQQKLGLEKETLISVARAIVQLIVVGYLLRFVFHVNNLVLTITMMSFILCNASYNGEKRARGISHSLRISFVALLLGGGTTMLLLVLTGAIKPVPWQLVPVTGMVMNNAMIAVGLVYRSLGQMYTDQKNQVFERLALGANPKEASGDIIKQAIKFGMQPTIDSIKTLGLVSLPGMMSGLIMAGVEPVLAIKYQIMVTFMILSSTALSSVYASYAAYKRFFDENWVLQLPKDK
ncbi:ABC transporter permease [Convivina intestini]|uniref:ABC transporter permease n=1 Tax=Convivina intestini TaxID=1505726 RepID=UPI0020102542|nr:iron export ABC transporter permease subunit FetB [Convivina intestini]CAH1850096.1 putative iron export permease protein FetB [Convivina intestini]